MFARQLELDPASVSSPDLLLLLQNEALETRDPVMGHRGVHVLGGGEEGRDGKQ